MAGKRSLGSRGGAGGAGGAAASAGTSRRHFTPEQRRQAVEAYRKAGLTVTDFARTWGISAWTFRQWRTRYEAHGPQGLDRISDGPVKPRGRPRLSELVREEIAAVKRRFPLFGLKKVRDFLARFAGLRVSVGSVRRTLSEEGLPPAPAPRRRRKLRASEPRRFERSRPGELWQSDITVLRLARADRNVYLVAFLDDHSRYVVGFGLHTHQKAEIVIEALLEGIARFGKPREVLTDQGRQYYAWRGKSDFQKVLRREGVEHVVSQAHHPQTVGKCERFWETVKREFWDRVMPEDLVEARERLSHFIAHYNHFRPHQGIDGLVPADRFFGSGSDVRAALERAMDRNEIRLALGERPRKPAYLVGQVGDQKVSLIGERGQIVIRTEDGRTEEIGMKDLGMPGRTSREEDDDDGASGGIVRGGGAGPSTGLGADGGDGAGSAAADPDREETGAVRAPAADAAAGARALGGGVGGRADPGPRRGGGDPGDVARPGDAGRGGPEALGASGAGVAALPAGPGGDGGGAPQAAPGTAPGGSGPASDPGGGSEVAAEPDRGDRGGSLAGPGPDRGPAGASGAPGAGAPREGAPRSDGAEADGVRREGGCETEEERRRCAGK